MWKARTYIPDRMATLINLVLEQLITFSPLHIQSHASFFYIIAVHTREVVGLNKG